MLRGGNFASLKFKMASLVTCALNFTALYTDIRPTYEITFKDCQTQNLIYMIFCSQNVFIDEILHCTSAVLLMIV